MWYRIDTDGAPVNIGKETGIITTSGSFTGQRKKYETEVEAYDNKRIQPYNFATQNIIVSYTILSYYNLIRCFRFMFSITTWIV